MQTAPPLNLRERFSYGIGPLAEGLLTISFSVFLFFYYNQVLGLSGSLAGTALLIGLLVDAVSDPWVGAVSDRMRSRLGRRHPFILVSAVPMGVFTVLLFAPPSGLGPWSLFAWLTVFTVLARLALTLFYVPHMSLGAELSSDYQERNNIVALRRFFSLIGTMVAVVVGFGFFFADSPEYPRGQLNGGAYLPYALSVGSLMIIAVLISAFGTMSRIPYLTRLHTRQPLTLRHFSEDYLSVFANLNFRALFLGVLGFYAVVGIYTTIGLHLNIHFWKLDSQQIFILVTAGALANVAGVPAWLYLTRFFTDKKMVFMLGLAWWTGFAILPTCLVLLGIVDIDTDPYYFSLLVISNVIAFFGAAATAVVGGSMVADCVDDQELVSGRRQEGNFFGAFAFGEKALSGVGTWLGGMLLDLISFPTNAVPGEVAGEVLVRLALAAGPGIALCGVLSFFFLISYRIPKARHQETLRVLQERRAANPSPDAGGYD